MVSEAPTIPIFIDDVKKFPDFRMTRCTYFSVESDDPIPNWGLEIGEQNIPLVLLGLEGIVIRPVKKELFDNTGTIKEYFDFIEDDSNYFIDVNDIWFPNFLFGYEIPKEKFVFRVSLELFKLGNQFRNDKIPAQRFIHECGNRLPEISFSPQENKAFADWEQLIIEEAKEIYPKNEAMALPYVDDSNLKA